MRLTQDRVAKALTKSGAVIADAAAILGVTPQAVYQFMGKHPELQQLRSEIEDEMLDRAEAHLADAVIAGDLDACRYLLDRRGKSRGFTTRIEIVRN